VIAAVVLAAGASSRMGRPKALLRDPDGCPFVARIVRSIAGAGVQRIVVVTGEHHLGIAQALESERQEQLLLARNPDPARGQLSSLWTGMQALDGDQPDALLVTLVDVPMIAPSTIRHVVDSWRRTHAPVVRPVMGEQHGHPVLFDASVFGELRQAPLEAGAKTVVRAHASDMIEVEVADPGCLVDIDTPEEYRKLRG
jgi:molybdenum cofactor cytidylyltransferase